MGFAFYQNERNAMAFFPEIQWEIASQPVQRVTAVATVTFVQYFRRRLAMDEQCGTMLMFLDCGMAMVRPGMDHLCDNDACDQSSEEGKIAAQVHKSSSHKMKNPSSPQEIC